MQATSAFISYTQDSPEHMTEVLGLCNRLRNEGVDCNIDRYHQAPPGGWAAWMGEAVEQADFVLVICTEALRERYEGKAEAGTGKGAKWEGAIVLEDLYESESRNTKYIPVLLSSGEKSHVPKVLRGTTYYDLDADDGYEKLYRRLTDQPEVEQPALGRLVTLPAQEVQWSSAELPLPEETTIGFVDDLVPNDADIYEAARAVAEGHPVSVRWSALNDELFELFTVRRPDLRRQLSEREVEEGQEMAKAIEAFDLVLGTASRRRDSAAERIPLMWAGISESEYFRGEAEAAFRDALKGFLIYVNVHTLAGLGTVQFHEDYRELPDGIRPGETSSSLFQHAAVANAFSYDPPFWAADTSFGGESFYVYAPKRLAIDAYRSGPGAAGFYMQKFLVPQMEYQAVGSSRMVTYDPQEVSIHKLRNEHFEEASYQEIDPL